MEKSSGIPLCNGFLIGIDTSFVNKSNIRICCWNVVREDSDHICSLLRFDGNMPVSVLHNSVGPVQNRERCMLSERPSLKLPVPHLGQVDIFKNVTTTSGWFMKNHAYSLWIGIPLIFFQKHRSCGFWCFFNLNRVYGKII